MLYNKTVPFDNIHNHNVTRLKYLTDATGTATPAATATCVHKTNLNSFH